MAQENQNGASKAAAAVTFTAVKPQLFVEAPKATDAVQFYKAAFGAEEVNRTMHPKRKADQELPLILSAEVKIGSYSLLVSDLADDSDALYGSLFLYHTLLVVFSLSFFSFGCFDLYVYAVFKLCLL